MSLCTTCACTSKKSIVSTATHIHVHTHTCTGTMYVCVLHWEEICSQLAIMPAHVQGY